MAELSNRVSISEQVLFRDLDGEAVLLHPESGLYFGLQGVALRIWHLLQTESRLERIYQTLLDEFDVSGQQLRDDLLDFLAKLEAKGLVKVDEG